MADPSAGKKPRLRALLVAGTGSDVGKSLIAAGLCRIFLQDGYHPAPFKGQNMALNSFVTPEGGEIGRAQAVQAAAAGVDPHTDMNPVLLKPTGEHLTQVIINGQAVGNRSAYDYFRKEGRGVLRRAVEEAYDRLAQRFNPIVLEGAGSVCELNLMDTDLANMPMARYADATVLLVADIDRGGVFASAYGSIMLQKPEDRRRIGGIVVNKFRGDLRLFEQGRRMLEEVCGVPVVGVVPMMEEVGIGEEDSVELDRKRLHPIEGKVNVGVVWLPHISNFTDFDLMEGTEGLNVYYARTAEDLAGADLIIVPGTKSTVADLRWLWQSGMAEAIIARCKAGVLVLGICGGYQMLGEKVSDPQGEEGAAAVVEGLGLLPVTTLISGRKTTRQVRCIFNRGADDWSTKPWAGYEIHQGRTEGTPLFGDVAETWVRMEDGREDGCLCGKALGTYVHGILDNPEVVEWLTGVKPAGERVDPYDRLAAHLRKYIDMEEIYKIMVSGEW